MNDNIKTYLKILEVLRKRHISQKSLAEQIKIKPSSLSRMLSGKYKVKLENLEKIAKILDLPVSFFINAEDTPYEYKNQDSYQVSEANLLSKEIDLLRKEADLLKKENLNLKSKLKK